MNIYDQLRQLWAHVTDLESTGGGSVLPGVTVADNGKILGVIDGSWDKMTAPSEISIYSVSSGSIDGTFAEVLADINAGKLVCITINSSMCVCFPNGYLQATELGITALGFYTIQKTYDGNVVYDYILSSDGSFTRSNTYPLVENYSTTEHDTGLKWIDGKPVYEKTFTGTTVSGLNTLLSGTDTLVSCEGYIVTDAGGTQYSMPVFVNGTNFASVVNGIVDGTKTLLLSVSGSTLAGKEFCITARYTKVTTNDTETKKATKKKTTK